MCVLLYSAKFLMVDLDFASLNWLLDIIICSEIAFQVCKYHLFWISLDACSSVIFIITVIGMKWIFFEYNKFGQQTGRQREITTATTVAAAAASVTPTLPLLYVSVCAGWILYKFHFLDHYETCLGIGKSIESISIPLYIVSYIVSPFPCSNHRIPCNIFLARCTFHLQ